MAYRSRWSPEEKIEIVMESLNTNVSMAELCRRHNVTPATVNGWKEKFFRGGKMALMGGLKDPKKEALDEKKETLDEKKELLRLIGEYAIANDALKKALTDGGKRR
jgi:transposase